MKLVELVVVLHSVEYRRTRFLGLKVEPDVEEDSSTQHQLNCTVNAVIDRKSSSDGPWWCHLRHAYPVLRLASPTARQNARSSKGFVRQVLTAGLNIRQIHLYAA